MAIRRLIKQIWLKFSPSYRKINHIVTRLESLQNIETRLENLQNFLSGNLERFVNEGAVYIHDYSNYIPKYRNSLKDSKISEIMENWYKTNHDEINALMQKFCSFRNFYKNIPFDSQIDFLPKWNNDFMSPFDAMSIYTFLAINNPRYYVEIGSGNTTMFAAQSINDNQLRTKIISIDPFPRAGIDSLCEKIYRFPLENMDLSFFSTLSNEDIFLFDGSHRSFPNSDVTVFFTEILHKLPPGLLYAIHDIFLPFDYPELWSVNERRWYNEQYLLCAYILGGASGDKIICPNAFLGRKKEIRESCNSLWGNGELFDNRQFGGGFFWLKKA